MYKKITTTTEEYSDMPMTGMGTEPTSNGKTYIPCIRVDAPLMMQLFDYANQESSTDADLQNLVEMMMKESADGSVLTMNDYPDLFPKTETAAPVIM